METYIQGFDQFAREEDFTTRSNMQNMLGLSVDFSGGNWFPPSGLDYLFYSDFDNAEIHGFTQADAYKGDGSKMLVLRRDTGQDSADCRNSNIMLVKTLEASRTALASFYCSVPKPTYAAPIFSLRRQNGTVFLSLWVHPDGSLSLSSTSFSASGSSVVAVTPINGTRTKPGTMAFDRLAYLRLAVDCREDETIVTLSIDGYYLIETLSIPTLLGTSILRQAAFVFASNKYYTAADTEYLLDDLVLMFGENAAEIHGTGQLSVSWHPVSVALAPTEWSAATLDGDAAAIGREMDLSNVGYIDNLAQEYVNLFGLTPLDLAMDQVVGFGIVAIGSMLSTVSVDVTLMSRGLEITQEISDLSSGIVNYKFVDLSEVFVDLSVPTVEYLNLKLTARQ